ncbi:hypothetical protein [Bradyrhizobium sp. Arg816]|uniref:hypothetical protein n=1 Tax=Bradyrhizobium sp. Arg816 TaxID=2998491 RepID=UPI00249E620D|nr:hypothetical protein [Bradyrhizobium sp. Arg816]MDI3565415.1 hypothetical protein [Bradyrhizobium sp. Arg816]
MDADERMFREKTIRALQSHITELDAMEKAVRKAAREHTEIPNLKEIVKELGDATAELRSVNNFYEDETVPHDMWNVVGHTLTALTDCNSALVLYLATNTG